MECNEYFSKKSDEVWGRICEEVRTEAAPFYLFHESMVKHNIEALRQCLGGKVKIAYAMKANPWLCAAAGSVANYVEVCSEGELEICANLGIPGEKLMVDGVLQTETFLKRSLELGVTRFGINSVRQMEQLIHHAKGQQLCILLRVTGGNQFGMSGSEIYDCVRLGRDCNNIQIKGLQYFPGTQRSDVRRVNKELDCLRKWIFDCDKLLGVQMEEIEFGAGIGFPYFETDACCDYQRLIEVVRTFIQEVENRYLVTYEAGRVIAASCGIYVTEIFDEKWRGEQKILFCLGGTNHLCYHGGILGVRVPRLRGLCANPAGIPTNNMICGSLCSESDVLVRECCSLDKNLTIGDRIVFEGVGAYAATESSNLFLGMEMPRILLYNEQGICCVRDSLPTYRLIDARM